MLNAEDEQHVIQVLLADLPIVVADFIEQSLRQQPDIQVAGRVQGSLEVLLTSDPDVDVLILGARQSYPPPGICSHLFSEFPGLRIIVLAGDQASLYWMGLCHRQTDKITTTAKLVENIRQIYHLESV